MDISKFVTRLHINAIVCSLALTYLATMLILHGDACAGASIAASIGTLAIAFAGQTNGNGAPENPDAPTAAIDGYVESAESDLPKHLEPGAPG